MALTKTQQSLYDKIASGSQLQSETVFDFAPERKPLSSDDYTLADLQQFAVEQQKQSQEDDKFSAWNALGSFAYQAVDTGSLGLAGVLADLVQPGTEERIRDELLDLESPEGKIAGMAGSVLGYVGGAPFKIARGVGQKVLIGPVAKLLGTQTEKAALKEFSKRGTAAGIDKNVISSLKNSISGTISRNAANSEITSKVFRKSLIKETDDVIRRGQAKRLINADDAEKIRKMVGKVADKGVPVQNMLQLGKQMYGNTGKGRFFGQALNDLFVFPFIDAAMEIVYQKKEMWRGKQEEFNYANLGFAVAAGVGTGIGLSSLEMLKPLGNMAKSKVDWMDGLKALMKRNPYAKMTQKELAGRLRFMGEMRFRNGKSTEVDIGGYKVDLLKHPADQKMGIKSLHEDLHEKFTNKKYKSIVVSYLNKEKNNFAKDMLKFARGEAWENFKGAMPRMLLGGAVFSGAHYAQMKAIGAEYGDDWDAYDIIGNILIGGFTQRKSNPHKWDMGYTSESRAFKEIDDINTMREGLMTMGFEVRQFDYSASMENANNRFGMSILRNNEELKDYLIKNRFVSDDDASLDSDSIKEGEISVLAAKRQGDKFDPMLEQILKMNSEIFNHSKGIDDISVSEAKDLIYNFKKFTNSKNVKELEEKFNDEIMSNTASFESQMVSLVKNLLRQNFSDLSNKLTSRPDSNRNEKLVIPQIFRISEALKKKARDGELDFLGDLRGQDAVYELQNVMDSFELITKGTVALKQGNFNQSDKSVTIKNEETLSYLFNSIRSSEKSIDEQYKQKDAISREFRYSQYADYLPSVMANKALTISRDVINIFSDDYAKKDNVTSQLIDAGILTDDGKIISNVNQINLSGVEDKDIGDWRLKLQQVLSIQRSLGGYVGAKDGTTTSTDLSKITSFKEFLNKEGLNLDDMGDWFHQKILQVINSDRFKGANLQPSESDFLIKATAGVFGRSEFNKTDGNNNFVLKKVSIPNNKQLETDYNTFIEKLASPETSNGIVIIEDGVLTLFKGTGASSMLKTLLDGAKNNKNKNNENIIISELFYAMQEQGLTNVRDKMHKYIQQYKGEAQINLLKWLLDAKIIVEETKDYSFRINDEQKIAYEFFKNIDADLSRMGYDDNFVDREYQRVADLAKGRLNNDAVDEVKNPSISLQQFFTKYRFIEIDPISRQIKEGVSKFINYSDYTAQQQKDIFDRIIQWPNPSSKDKYFRWDSIPKILKRAGKEKDGKVVPIDKLGRREKKQLVEDLIQIVFGRRNIVTGKEMKVYADGLKIEDKPYHMQKNEITELFNEMKVELILFNPDIIARGFNSFSGKPVTKIYNIDDDSPNIPGYLSKVINQQKDILRKSLGQWGFNSEGELHKITREDTLDKPILQGGSQNHGVPDVGLTRVQIYSGMDSIILKSSDKYKVGNKFLEFYEKHINKDNITNTDHKGILDNLKEEFENSNKKQTPTSEDNYQLALRMLVLERMLRSNKNQKLYDTINSTSPNDVAKVLKRIKLVNTKNFVRPNKDYIYSVIRGRTKVDKDDIASSLLKNRLDEKGKNGLYTVSIWNDEGSALINREVEDVIKKYSKKYPQILNWRRNFVMGNAHKDATAFDSISFISKDMMMESHALMGHNPDSKNPIKPVISSTGDGQELLLGKTLFVYEPKLDDFFSKNEVDVLITKSGAKVYEESVSGPNKRDDSIINNVKWNELSETSLETTQKRFIPIESIGFKPEKDASITSAKESPSDANLFNDFESKMKLAEITGDLDFAIEKMHDILKSPISMRQFMIDEIGDGELPVNSSSMNVQTINNMLFFLTNPDANPMSYSDRMVKNKLYSAFINNIVNNTRSVTRRSKVDDNNKSKRYGGQAPIIQSLSSFNNNDASRLLPTLVDEKGKMLLRGEIALPYHERISTLKDLEGRGIRIVDNEKIFTIDEFLDDYYEKSDVKFDKKDRQEFKDILKQSTLEDVYFQLKNVSGEVDAKYQLGIISRRNPRTRPNDITILGLAGFLDEGYGNSAMVNSMDIVNVYEGDYDADKIDYFFAHNDYFFDHIKRSQSFFVQAIDPEQFEMDSNFTFGMSAKDSSTEISRMEGNARSYKKAIGIVQKTPRQLNYLDSLSNKNWFKTVQGKRQMSDFIREDEQGNIYGPGELFENAKGQKITIDYRNIEFFMRSALEMQYIVDGNGNLNPEIARDIFSWKDDFLFPLIDNSFAPGEFTKRDADEMLQNKGVNNNGKRIRIFQKLEYNKTLDKYEESNSDLTNAEKSIIKQFISQYSELLQTMGKEHYADSGEAQRVDFDTFITQANIFKAFNNNIQYGVFKNIKNRRDLPPNDWKEIKEIFGFKYDKKIKNKYYLNRNPFEQIKQQGERISNGESGSYIDRIAIRMAKEDFFANEDRSILSNTMDDIDNWYSEMLANSNIDDADTHNEALVNSVLDINKQIGSIKYLQKKIKQIYNSNASQDWKVNKVKKIKYVQGELRKKVSEYYGKTALFKNVKDLEKIEFVNLETDKDLQYSTIYFNNLNSLLRTELIGASGFNDFKSTLDDEGTSDLKRLKKLRSGVYGETTLIEEIAKYGDKSILSARDIEIINNYNVDDFYEWQLNFLNEKMNKHGFEFLLAFMEPSKDRKKVGIYRNRAVSIPYVDTSRYRLGMRLLTDLTYGKRAMSKQAKDLGILGHEQIGDKAQETAGILFNLLQDGEAHYTKFFTGNHMMRRASNVNRERYQLARFDDYLEKQILSYKEFSWMRNTMPYNTTSITNNSVIDFYKTLYYGMGKQKQFDKFLEEMDDISIELSSNSLVNPYRYIGMRLQLDSDFQKFTSEGIDNLYTNDYGKEDIVKITNHKAFKLSRGFKFMQKKAASEGLTLEKSSKLILNRISDLVKIEGNLIKAKENLIIKEESKEKWNSMKQAAGC